MRARARVAAAILATILLAAACADRPWSSASTTRAPSDWTLTALERRFQARARVTSMLWDELRRTARALTRIQTQVIRLADAAAVEEAQLSHVDPALVQAKHVLGRSEKVVEPGAVDMAQALTNDPGSLTDLVAPMQVVVDALFAADRYQIELLRGVGVVRQQAEATQELWSTVLRLRAGIAEREHELQASLADAQLGAAIEEGAVDEGEFVVAEGPRASMREVREQLHRAQTSEEQLRAIEARLRAISVQLQARRGALVEELAEAQRRVNDLNDVLSQVERVVGNRYAVWFGSGTPPWGATRIDGVLQICPVDPPHAYTDTFGAPRYAGGYHPHQGNDIFAPEGTPIRAPFPGDAVIATNTLGGVSVKVYGRDGYVYNAHLSRIGRLGPVRTGDIIGYVGNTGDAINSAPHDHFEWHPAGGDAVDPYPYLNAVCLPPAPPSPTPSPTPSP